MDSSVANSLQIRLYKEYEGQKCRLSTDPGSRKILLIETDFVRFYRKIIKKIYLCKEKNQKKTNKRNTELQWKPLPVLIVLPTHFEHIFYGLHCTSELRLFLTQFKCKCKHKSPAICHIDVLLMI